MYMCAVLPASAGLPSTSELIALAVALPFARRATASTPPPPPPLKYSSFEFIYKQKFASTFGQCNNLLLRTAENPIRKSHKIGHVNNQKENVIMCDRQLDTLF